MWPSSSRSKKDAGVQVTATIPNQYKSRREERGCPGFPAHVTLFQWQGLKSPGSAKHKRRLLPSYWPQNSSAANRPGDGIRVITPSRKILNRDFHVCLCYDTGVEGQKGDWLLNIAKKQQERLPGPVLTKTDAVTDRARGCTEGKRTACSGRPWCCPSSLPQRRRKRSGQKARDASKGKQTPAAVAFGAAHPAYPRGTGREIWAESSGCTEGK